MNRTQWIEDIQKNLSDLIARSPAADLERNVKAMMGQAFTKMDLITREEFDVQADLLARARERVDQLQAQVQQLEVRVAAVEDKPQAGFAAGRASPPTATNQTRASQTSWETPGGQNRSGVCRHRRNAVLRPRCRPRSNSAPAQIESPLLRSLFFGGRRVASDPEYVQ